MICVEMGRARKQRLIVHKQKAGQGQETVDGDAVVIRSNTDRYPTGKLVPVRVLM